MGTAGEWLGVLFIGTVCGILLAVKIPLRGASERPQPSTKIWVGCLLTSFATGLMYAFGMRTLRSPLIFILTPAAIVGMFLYAMPMTRARQSSPLLWTLRWLLAGLGIILTVAFGQQSIQKPIVFFTLPVFAACMIIDWIGSRTKRA